MRLRLAPASSIKGEFDLAREHGDRIIELYDPRLHGQHALENPRISGGMLSFLAVWMLGYPDQSLAEEAVALSSEQGFPHWESKAAVERGWALTEQGHGDEGMALIGRGTDIMQATGARNWLPYQLSLLVEAHTKGWRAQEALTLLGEASKLPRETKERYWEAELHRMKGELYLAERAEGVGKALQCPLVAISGRKGCVDLCPLSGVLRTSQLPRPMSAFDEVDGTPHGI